ncbi:unnamed protein product, partial [Ostreobium quekettii]
DQILWGTNIPFGMMRQLFPPSCPQQAPACAFPAAVHLLFRAHSHTQKRIDTRGEAPPALLCTQLRALVSVSTPRASRSGCAEGGHPGRSGRSGALKLARLPIEGPWSGMGAGLDPRLEAATALLAGDPEVEAAASLGEGDGEGSKAMGGLPDSSGRRVGGA